MCRPAGERPGELPEELRAAERPMPALCFRQATSVWEFSAADFDSSHHFFL